MARKIEAFELLEPKKSCFYETIRGVPELKPKSGRIYSPCQVGKRENMFNKMVQHLVTTYVLELLHMDPMGPMQEESI